MFPSLSVLIFSESASLEGTGELDDQELRQSLKTSSIQRSKRTSCLFSDVLSVNLTVRYTLFDANLS